LYYVREAVKKGIFLVAGSKNFVFEYLNFSVFFD